MARLALPCSFWTNNVLQVVHHILRQGFQTDPQSGFVQYVPGTDGSLLPGDIVVRGHYCQSAGAGNNFFLQYGADPVIDIRFLSNDGGVTDLAAQFTVGDAQGGSLACFPITAATLTNGVDPLTRFGWKNTNNNFVGGSLAIWVVRSAVFNVVADSGFDGLSNVPIICPVVLDPAVAGGVLTDTQMAFGFGYVMDGGGFNDPAHVVTVDQNLAGVHQNQRTDTWSSAFGLRNQACCSVYGEPGDDVTGLLYTTDTVPTGGTLPAVDIVSSQTAGLLAILDLTETLTSAPGFGYGIQPFG